MGEEIWDFDGRFAYALSKLAMNLHGVAFQKFVFVFKGVLKALYTAFSYQR